MGTMQIPITKAGKEAFISVNTDDPTEGGDLPATVYNVCLAEGLKSMLNKNMGKILTKDLTGDDLTAAQTAAMEKAQENFTKLKSGDIGRAGPKTEKLSGKIKTEAMRLARIAIKDEMKDKGVKVSYVESSTITQAAKALLAADPSYIDLAKANLEAVATKATHVASVVSNDMINPEKKAKADKAAADRKAAKSAQLSATQAGKPKVRSKPQQATAH